MFSIRYMLLSSILCVLIVIAFSTFNSAAQAQDTCEGLTGQARGLCIAADRAGCTDPMNASKACIELAEQYSNTVEEPPPWQSCPCFTLGSLNEHVIVLEDYGCVDEVVDGTFGAVIVTGSADYLVASTYQWGNWGTVCQHIDITFDYSIYNIVYDITFEQAMACRDILLASEMWAVNLCPNYP